MKALFSSGLRALLLAAAASGAAAATLATPLPGDSVLQLQGKFTSQSGRTFQLAARRSW